MPAYKTINERNVALVTKTTFKKIQEKAIEGTQNNDKKRKVVMNDKAIEGSNVVDNTDETTNTDNVKIASLKSKKKKRKDMFVENELVPKTKKNKNAKTNKSLNEKDDDTTVSSYFTVHEESSNNSIEQSILGKTNISIVYQDKFTNKASPLRLARKRLVCEGKKNYKVPSEKETMDIIIDEDNTMHGYINQAIGKKESRVRLKNREIDSKTTLTNKNDSFMESTKISKDEETLEVNKARKNDAMNSDEEKSDDEWEWEIDRDWNRKYYRRNLRAKNKSGIIKVIEICNHRKCKNFEGELLVMWNNGIREWKYASAVASDWNDMVMEYLTINELSLEAMNFGKWVAENQQKKEQKRKMG